MPDPFDNNFKGIRTATPKASGSCGPTTHVRIAGDTAPLANITDDHLLDLVVIRALAGRGWQSFKALNEVVQVDDATLHASLDRLSASDVVAIDPFRGFAMWPPTMRSGTP